MPELTIDPLVVKLLEAKDEAARRGLWTTMHKIDAALQRLGWELAGHKTETPYERQRKECQG